MLVRAPHARRHAAAALHKEGGQASAVACHTAPAEGMRAHARVCVCAGSQRLGSRPGLHACEPEAGGGTSGARHKWGRQHRRRDIQVQSQQRDRERGLQVHQPILLAPLGRGRGRGCHQRRPGCAWELRHIHHASPSCARLHTATWRNVVSYRPTVWMLSCTARCGWQSSSQGE